MRVRLGAALSLSAILAVLSFALSAGATSAPVPITNSCLSVIVAPHTVSVGGVVTAHTGPGTGGCTHTNVEWNWFVNGEKETTCGTNSASCSIKASRATSGFRPICAVGTGASPGVQACDYVEVVTSGVDTVSGRITALSPLIKRLAKSTPKLANVADAKVEAIDSHGRATSTTTAADGSYSLGVPAGRYTIRVDPEAGIGYHASTTPASRTVVVKGDIENVNFGLGRVIHLVSEAEYTGFGSERGSELDLRFFEHKKRVGGATIDCHLVCVGRARIKGIIGIPWLRVAWRDIHASGGEGVMTTGRVESEEDGAPNYPSEDNFYEGTITVHAGPIEERREREHPFPVTIELI
jgi:Carboxypeptidase regulatory-like domain